jgi:hypothetical protein
MTVKVMTNLVVEMGKEDAKKLASIAKANGETKEKTLHRAIKNFLSKGVRTETSAT